MVWILIERCKSLPTPFLTGIILKHLIVILNNNDNLDVAFGSSASAQQSISLRLKPMRCCMCTRGSPRTRGASSQAEEENVSLNIQIHSPRDHARTQGVKVFSNLLSREGNGNPLQYSCQENPMERGTWRATIHGVIKSQTWLSDWACKPPKGVAEDKTVGWHHRLNGHEFEQALGASEGQGSLLCCSPWGCKESDTT